MARPVVRYVKVVGGPIIRVLATDTESEVDLANLLESHGFAIDSLKFLTEREVAEYELEWIMSQCIPLHEAVEQGLSIYYYMAAHGNN